MQKRLVKNKNYVTEGRDMGSYFFPESDFISKIISKSLSIKNGKSLKVKEQQYIIYMIHITYNRIWIIYETILYHLYIKPFKK